MFRIVFAIFMLLGVVGLEFKLHPATHWATFKLAAPEDLNYLQEQGATFRAFGRSGFELKMDATGVACLQNLRDCQALRVKTAIQNVEMAARGALCHRQRVVRHHDTFAAVDDLESDVPASRNQELVDIVILDIGSRVLSAYDKALARCEVESEQTW